MGHKAGRPRNTVLPTEVDTRSGWATASGQETETEAERSARGTKKSALAKRAPFVALCDAPPRWVTQFPQARGLHRERGWGGVLA